MKWSIRNIILMPWRGAWSFVWDFCEDEHISLGRLAPWVLNQAIVSDRGYKVHETTGGMDNEV